MAPTKEEVPEAFRLCPHHRQSNFKACSARGLYKKPGVTPVKAFVLKEQHFKVVLLSLPTTRAKDGVNRKD